MSEMTPERLRMEARWLENYGLRITAHVAMECASAWEADIGGLRNGWAIANLRAQKAEARIEELERKLESIECAECERNLLHCTCNDGLAVLAAKQEK